MREPILDVRHHSFTRRPRGADPREVEAVLGEVAPACDELRDALRQLEQQLADARAEIERLMQGERSVIRLFASAEEYARMCLGSARREAARISGSAEERARQLVAAAEEERVRWTNELRSLEWKRERVFSAIDEALAAAETRAAVGHPPPTTSPAFATGPVGTEPETTELAPGPRAAEADPPHPPGDDDDATWSAEELSSVFDTLPELEASPAPAPLDDESPLEPEVDEDQVIAQPQWWRTARLGRAAAAAVVLIATAAMAIPAARDRRAAATPTPRTAPHVSTAEPVPHLVTAPVEEPRPVAAERPAPSDPVVLRLTTLRACWVRVTVDGRAEEMTLEEGSELTRGGKDRIQVRIGDASAATLEVNGEVLPPLGRPGQVVSRTFTATAHREATATTGSELRPGA